jgi:hypothetical protein
MAYQLSFGVFLLAGMVFLELFWGISKDLF